MQKQHPMITSQNEVTAITNTSYANFWAVNNSKSKISNKYKQGVGTGSCNLIFTKSGYNSTNTHGRYGNGKLSISIINCICKWKCRF